MWAQDSGSHSPLPTESLRLRRYGVVKRFPEKVTLLSKGRKPFSLGVMIEGVVEIRSYSILGSGRVVQLLGPGDILSEGQIGNWSLNAETATPVAIRCVDKFMLEKLLAQNAALASTLEDELAYQLQRAHETRRGMDGQTPVERLARFLLQLLERPLQPTGNVVSLHRNPIISVPISRVDLTNYLGISQGRLAEAVQKMEKRALIRQLTARHFEILDENGLVKMLPARDTP